MLKKLGVWIAANLVKFLLSILASLLAAIGFTIWSQQSTGFSPTNISTPTEEIILFPDITDTPLVEKQVTPATNTPVPPTLEPPTPTAVPTITRVPCAVNQYVSGLQVDEKQYYSPSMHWIERQTRNTAMVGTYTANGDEVEKYEIDLLALTDGWWTFVYEFGNTGVGFVICSGGNGVYWGVDYKSRYIPSSSK